MGEFLMPSLGSDMESGTLVEWEKNPGETVTRGDVVAVVETQKGAIEIEAFENGTLTKQLVEIGTQVPVGTPLAVIDPITSSVSKDAEDAAASVDTDSEVEDADLDTDTKTDTKTGTKTESIDTQAVVFKSGSVGLSEQPVRQTKDGNACVGQGLEAALSRQVNENVCGDSQLLLSSTGRRRITPAARAQAQKIGLAINVLTGTGPSGAIVLDDVISSSSKHGKLTNHKVRKTVDNQRLIENKHLIREGMTSAVPQSTNYMLPSSHL